MTQAMHGARAIFRVAVGDQKEQVVAVAQNCTYNEDDNLQPVEVFGREVPAEHAEIGRSISFTVDTVRVATQSAIDLGLSPKLQTLLDQPTLTVSIEDKVENITIFNINGVKKTSRNGTMNARGLFTESISFVGLVMSDNGEDQNVMKDGEGAPSYPFG